MIRDEALALGRFKRTPARWETEFGRWVSETGVPRIVAALAHDPDLRVTNNAVYSWLRGHAPRPERAQALVELSGGRLTLDDIYDHARQVRRRAGHGSAATQTCSTKQLAHPGRDSVSSELRHRGARYR